MITAVAVGVARAYSAEQLHGEQFVARSSSAQTSGVVVRRGGGSILTGMWGGGMWDAGDDASTRADAARLLTIGEERVSCDSVR